MVSASVTNIKISTVEGTLRLVKAFEDLSLNLDSTRVAIGIF
jgi:hypothetical protein